MKLSNEENTIFIQIAAYRDPQLVPTLKDMLSKAKYPNNLRIGIAWQHAVEDSWDNLDKFKNDPRFRILDFDYTQSQGTCWARNQVQQLYKGEKYTLQLDSHHRFLQDWDLILIEMLCNLQQQGIKKPLITGSLHNFDPDNDLAPRYDFPLKSIFDKFMPEGAVLFYATKLDSWDDETQPLPSRFYCGHFAFTLGQFSTEVQHDPNFYFYGEEISIAVRAYTHGYDLFTPNKTVCWHEYIRKGKTKQWDDDKTWFTKNDAAHLRNRKLLEMDGEINDIDFGIYGLGTVRTLKDYEKYAGISFKHRAIQKFTACHLPPLVDLQKHPSDEEFEQSLLNIFVCCIDINQSQVPEDDYDFWTVAFKNNMGDVIYRKDAYKDEILQMKNNPNGYCEIWREFYTEIPPASWVVIPYSPSKSWADPIEGNI